MGWFVEAFFHWTHVIMTTVSLQKESTLTDLTVITYDVLKYIQLC